jgi:mono/diheme cytochrome c family protein
MYFLFYLLFIPAILLANQSDFEVGKRLYMKTCSVCHGKNGAPNKKLEFKVKPRDLCKTILTKQQTYEIIKHGTYYWGSSADIMPAFKDTYSDKEIHAIANYISMRFNKDVDQKIQKLYDESEKISSEKEAKMLKRGEKIYKRNCSWCHGLDARGKGEATKTPQKTIYPYNLRKTLLTNKQMFLYAKYGGHYWGTDKDDMPSWMKKYDDFTLKSVIKYIDVTFRNGAKTPLKNSRKIR